MCGIAGVITWDERFRVSRETLERMRACIDHRGPDANGMWINHEREITAENPQAGLAHARLAVIDLDPRANQPFTDHRGRWVVFNGEIYNFRELRAALSDYPWRTSCDTEVLLAAYEAWGPACVDRLNGMFAFAIWDENAKVAFLARDRMGQKPLYFTLLGGRDAACRGIAFASELRALRFSPGFDDATDSGALSSYLRWGYIPAPATIFASAEKLPPATWMQIGSKKAALEKYFDPNELTLREPGVDAVARTRELVVQSVRRQLVADVPLGCFLSGGIDSSIIAAAMKRAAGGQQDVLTFSIGFEDKRYDETPFAAEVARHLKTKHRQCIVKPEAAEDLPKLAAVFVEPFGDSSALPTHYLSRETRRHVTVALSGDGGDELFAGYDRYRALWLAQAFDEMPERLKKIALSKLWQRVPGIHPKNPVTRAKRLLASLELPPARRYDSYMRLFSDETVDALVKIDRGGDWLAKEFERLRRDRDVVETAMALDRVTYLPGDLLFKVDGCSMLHALEVRSPFMDHELVAFAAGLPTRELLGKSPDATSFMQTPMTMPGKRLLRKAFADDLPASVFKRRKSGFGVPIGEWLRTSLRSMLVDSLMAKDSFASVHFDKRVIEKILAEHQAKKAEHGQRLYALLMLELWHRSFH